MGFGESVESFDEHVCNCKTCKEVINNYIEFGGSTIKNISRSNGFVRRQFPTTDAKKKCLKYYIRCKGREYLTVATEFKEYLISLLESSYEKYSKIVSLEELNLLKKWI